MTYYHSGVNQYGHAKILDDEGVAGMVSATTITQPKMKKALKDFDLPLVLDSGGFQGYENVDEYIDIIHELSSRFRWYAVLDEIGCQFTADINMLIMEDAGLSPLWIYQVDGGTGLYHLKRQAKKYDFVGIGGLVQRSFSDPTHLVRMIQKIGSVLASVNAEAHFFGIGSPRILGQFYDADWFCSADSQKWVSGKRSRTIYTRQGETVSSADLSFSGEECARQNIRQIEDWASANRQLAIHDN